jgi:multisubunit Na+/H+ antiporter MnhF subunit
MLYMCIVFYVALIVMGPSFPWQVLVVDAVSKVVQVDFDGLTCLGLDLHFLNISQILVLISKEW